MGWTNWERVSGDGLEFDEIVYEKKRHEDLGGGVARITIDEARQVQRHDASHGRPDVPRLLRREPRHVARRDHRGGRGQALRRGRRRRLGALGAPRGVLLPLPAQPADPNLAQAGDRAGAGLLPRRSQPHGLLLRFHDRRRRRELRPGRTEGLESGRRLLRAVPRERRRRQEGARDVDAVPPLPGEPGARDGPRERGGSARGTRSGGRSRGARTCCASRPAASRS